VNLDLKSVIGTVAGIFTTISFIPQVLHVIKTKSTKDISLTMFVLFLLGVIFWLIYGIIINEIPIIIANTLIAILAGIILVYKIKYK
jgi:MtN3 and saliva related transmembrane protein